jgi:hypothetical protein
VASRPIVRICTVGKGEMKAGVGAEFASTNKHEITMKRFIILYKERRLSRSTNVGFEYGRGLRGRGGLCCCATCTFLPAHICTTFDTTRDLGIVAQHASAWVNIIRNVRATCLHEKVTAREVPWPVNSDWALGIANRSDVDRNETAAAALHAAKCDLRSLGYGKMVGAMPTICVYERGCEDWGW